MKTRKISHQLFAVILILFLTLIVVVSYNEYRHFQKYFVKEAQDRVNQIADSLEFTADYLNMNIDIKNLQRYIFNLTAQNNIDIALIVDHKFKVLANNHYNLVGKTMFGDGCPFKDEVEEKYIRDIIEGKKFLSAQIYENRILAIRPIFGEAFSNQMESGFAIVLLDISELKERHQKEMLQYICIIILIAFIFISIVYFILRAQLQTPIDRLIRSIQNSKKDKALVKPLLPNNELSILADEFHRHHEDMLQILHDTEEYSYVIAHDLKAPIRAIQNISEIILEDFSHNLDPEAASLLQKLNDRASWTKMLVNDVLAYSKISHDTLKIQRLNIELIIEEVLDQIELQDNIEFDITFRSPWFYIDRIQVSQLILNVITNAIKYNDKETTKISISDHFKDEFHVLSITDNGIGIAEDQQEAIFDIFKQLNAVKQKNSVGIGLSIVKKIMKRHHGKITLKSILKEYSCFQFHFPNNPNKN